RFSRDWSSDVCSSDLSAHPICAAAGVANLKLIDDLGLVENAARVGAHFRTALGDALAGHAHVGEVRGDGLMAAVEFVEDRDARRSEERRVGKGCRCRW